MTHPYFKTPTSIVRFVVLAGVCAVVGCSGGSSLTTSLQSDGAAGRDSNQQLVGDGVFAPQVGHDSEFGEAVDHGEEQGAEVLLSDADMQIRVEYENEANGEEFEISVRGGMPGETLSVTVAGLDVFTIRLDNNGGGYFEFATVPDSSRDAQLPTDFPMLQAGDSVSVGTLSGVLIMR
jgi:hypothetical protein